MHKILVTEVTHLKVEHSTSIKCYPVQENEEIIKIRANTQTQTYHQSKLEESILEIFGIIQYNPKFDYKTPWGTTAIKRGLAVETFLLDINLKEEGLDTIKDPEIEVEIDIISERFSPSSITAQIESTFTIYNLCKPSIIKVEGVK
ncbi:hypothetical protein [Halonatronum saccharophilum]|uniref:hypothetical protein n=1 Tax=Halonatronum saccharophilum TaxID=150060 RepID=UPI0004869502|nr:hypothetical protein [Halonatronum saccharophilum]